MLIRFHLRKLNIYFSYFPHSPFFSILTIKLFVEKFQKQNVIISIILSVIIVSSILFYYYQFDAEHDRESILIAKHVLDNTTMVNTYHPESRFIKSFDLPQKWSDLVSVHQNADRTKKLEDNAIVKTPTAKNCKDKSGWI